MHHVQVLLSARLYGRSMDTGRAQDQARRIIGSHLTSLCPFISICVVGSAQSSDPVFKKEYRVGYNTVTDQLTASKYSSL
jgi:hypothetical protein